MIFGKTSADSGARNAANAMSPELQLLFACAKPITRPDDEALIRRILADGVDWTVFARKALDHNLLGLAGQTLARVAADLVPDELLDAFAVNLEETRSRNRELFAELTTIVQALARDGIDAIPFKGPVLAVQAYGDIGLRVFRDLDFLIRDRDIRATREALRRLGYDRPQPLTEAQIDLIEYLQGQDLVMKNSAGIAIEPHSRLISAKMVLDIDYEGLWSRARPSVIEGQSMLVFAPEDHLQILAVHGGKEMWWRISWVCDIAAFIESHPSLDWNAILMRAREQGSLRMLLLAASLVQEFSGASIPGAVMEAARADSAIPELVRDIAAGWSADAPLGPPSNKTVSMSRLRLHDGFTRGARYIARTLFLPGPHHVAWVALPRPLAFAYVPLKFVHDLALLPLWRVRGYVWKTRSPNPN